MNNIPQQEGFFLVEENHHLLKLVGEIVQNPFVNGVAVFLDDLTLRQPPLHFPTLHFEGLAVGQCVSQSLHTLGVTGAIGAVTKTKNSVGVRILSNTFFS